MVPTLFPNLLYAKYRLPAQLQRILNHSPNDGWLREMARTSVIYDMYEEDVLALLESRQLVSLESDLLTSPLPEALDAHRREGVLKASILS